MKKEILESYKGVRDFYPQDQFVLDYIRRVMSETCELFGFEHYGASVLESADLYRNKTSDEIVNEQTYIFEDRGGREVVLRPEMTPTVARMVAKKRRELGFPLRLYSIPNVFRYERPQKGRLREHWQLNADIFGAEGMDYEIELVALVREIFFAFGAKEEDFLIKINSRSVLDKIFNELEVPPLAAKSTLALLDRKAKISEEDFDEHLTRILANEKDAFLAALKHAEAEGELKNYLDEFKLRGINNVVVDSSVVRGFDYYTGFIFEVFDTDKANPRALCGGGRYDNLMKSLGQEPVPTLGFGMGDVTIRDFMDLRGLLPEYEPASKLMIMVLQDDPELKRAAFDLSERFRRANIETAVNYSARKFDKQIKTADKLSIPYVVALEDKCDLDKDEFTLIKLSDKSKHKLSFDSAVFFVTDSD